MREIDPDVRLYLNLLPSYNDTYTWKKNAFQEYVSTFTFDVDPEMLSVDYYVFGDRTDCNPNVLSADQGLWRDMGLFRMLALETGKPFEFYIQGVGDFSASKDIGNMTAERIAFQKMCIRDSRELLPYENPADEKGPAAVPSQTRRRWWAERR